MRRFLVGKGLLPELCGGYGQGDFGPGLIQGFDFCLKGVELIYFIFNLSRFDELIVFYQVGVILFEVCNDRAQCFEEGFYLIKNRILLCHRILFCSVYLIVTRYG
jgi:hypothetical protein